MPKINVSKIKSLHRQPKFKRLLADWAQLPPLERTERLCCLVDEDVSRRAIAKVVGCSEAWIRQLLDLQNLTAEEKQAMRKGSLGVVEALRRIRRRRLVQPQPQPAKDPTVDLHVDPKAVSLTTQQEQRPRIPARSPEPTEEEKAKLVVLLVQAFVEWILSLGIRGALLANLFQEFRGGPRGFNLLAPAKSQPWEVSLGSDPRAVIERCRPEGEIPTDAGAFLTYCVRWIARWSPQLMPPDLHIRPAILDRVSRFFQGGDWF